MGRKINKKGEHYYTEEALALFNQLNLVDVGSRHRIQTLNEAAAKDY